MPGSIVIPEVAAAPCGSRMNLTLIAVNKPATARMIRRLIHGDTLRMLIMRSPGVRSSAAGHHLDRQADHLAAYAPEARGDAAVMSDRLGSADATVREEPIGDALDLGRGGDVDHCAGGLFGTGEEGFYDAWKQTGPTGHIVAEACARRTGGQAVDAD